jgi:O-antigen ligase
MLYLILLFTVLFFILAWRRLTWAVMFLIVTMPTYLIRFSIFGLPGTLLEIMIWVVFVIWLIKNYRFIFRSLKLKIENYKLKIANRYPFDWEMILLLLIAFMAVAVAGFSSSSLGIFKAYFFEPVMFFIVVFNVMKNPSRPPLLKGVELVLWSLAISAFAVSVLAIYQKITGAFIYNPIWAAADTRRVVSFFGYPNAVGLYLGPIILIMIGWLSSVISSPSFSEGEKSLKDFLTLKGFLTNVQNDKMKVFFISLTIIVSTLSIYFAKSKGALLGVATGLMVFGLMINKKIRWATIIILILMGIGIAAYQPARNLAIENITFTNKSGQIRMIGWQETWRMLKDGRLITGAGLANFKTAVAPYHAEGFFIETGEADWLKKIRASAEYRKQMWQPLEIYLYPHNIILNFWSELGLAGIMLFVWIILKYFWMGIKNYQLPNAKYKYINIGLICAMVVIVVHGIVDVPYFKNDLSVMFWLFVAMISMINLEKYENNI